MSRTLKIALSMRVVNTVGHKERRDALAHDWFRLFDEWDAIPICIPNVLENIEPLIKMADLVILTGGDDITLDAENNTILDLEKHTKDRDIQEYRIIDTCIKNNIPVLGVCRGMQLINYKFGGHLNAVESQKHVAKKHKLIILNNDVLKQRLDVNSYHNYGIHLDSLGKDLEVLATSDDGSIEAIAHKKHSIIGIMWHPERNKPFCSADKEIVINLIKKSLGD